MTKLSSAAAGILMAVSSATCYAGNPFITSIYTADPSAHVWEDGRLYVYPSRDMDPPQGCDLMDRYHVFSTGNMVTWRDEGEILRANQVPWGRAEGGFMWAPDCAYRKGTYYFYYPHPSGTRWNDTWKIGVATSTKPASDFKVGGYIEGLDGFAMIDPAVFVDSDDQAYIYFGGGGHCKSAKLKPNMVEIDGPAQDMLGLVDFHEATWVFKRNGIYYLTYADNHPDANRLQYATSSCPMGPWKHRGIYLEPTGCDTSHGSVVEFHDQWYAFYHNKSLSGQGNLRSICVDHLTFNDDGTMQVVVQTSYGTSSDTPASGTNPLAVRYSIATAKLQNGATIGNTGAANGGKCVQNLHLVGAGFLVSQIEGGVNGGQATVGIHYASADRAKLDLIVNGVDFSFLNIFPTGSWNNFLGCSCLTVPLRPGKTNTIQVIGGNGGINVDYLEIVPLR